MHLLVHITLGACYVSLYETACVLPNRTVHQEYAQDPGETVIVATPNYDVMSHKLRYKGAKYFTGTMMPLFEYENIKYKEVKAPMGTPVPYIMNDGWIFTYSFFNKGPEGTIRLIFTEYDINPGSLLYIYDGRDVSAPGSLWKHNSPSPVFASTGPHVFMVFKPGNMIGHNRHIGFVAEVFYMSAGSTWKTIPTTLLCAPIKLLRSNYAVFTHIIYETALDVPVYCSYITEVPDQRVLLVITNEEVSGTFEVFDYPSAIAGKKVSPQKISKMKMYKAPFSMHNMTIYQYNMKSAVYGYHLFLQPNFTEPDQMVITASSKNSRYAFRALTWIMNNIVAVQKPPEHTYCPYRGTECAEYNTPCCYYSDSIVDDTCYWYYEAGDPDTYSQCYSDKHCYHTDIDLCDGFCDRDDGTDELYCKNDYEIDESTATKSQFAPVTPIITDNTTDSTMHANATDEANGAQSEETSAHLNYTALYIVLALVTVAGIVIAAVIFVRRERNNKALCKSCCTNPNAANDLNVSYKRLSGEETGKVVVNDLD